MIYNNSQPDRPLIVNDKKVDADNHADFTINYGFVFEKLTEPINNVGHNTAHHFFAYENVTENKTDCTKLVLEAELDGVIYYYPILINQDDYRSAAVYDHCGVKRNHIYSYNIVVRKPGSLDPNTPIVHGALTVNLTVKDWANHYKYEKIF